MYDVAEPGVEGDGEQRGCAGGDEESFGYGERGELDLYERVGFYTLSDHLEGSKLTSV